mmetsp:Transcript_12505/g.29835  ORF Transcript_12505/g.29835 Transcript_12505/m.29835 type:complete len:218 (+) Transcript_12505:199-852(+)
MNSIGHHVGVAVPILCPLRSDIDHHFFLVSYHVGFGLLFVVDHFIGGQFLPSLANQFGQILKSNFPLWILAIGSSDFFQNPGSFLLEKDIVGTEWSLWTILWFLSILFLFFFIGQCQVPQECSGSRTPWSQNSLFGKGIWFGLFMRIGSTVIGSTTIYLWHLRRLFRNGPGFILQTSIGMLVRSWRRCSKGISKGSRGTSGHVANGSRNGSHGKESG